MRSFRIAFSILMLLCTIVKAQDFTVGLRYNYGEAYYKQIDNSESTLFTKINQFGLTFAFSPYYSKFSIESGLELEKKDPADYLTVPLGFRITLGKKVKPFFEGGVYYSFLMKEYTNTYEMKNDFGARLGGGLQFALGRQWRLELGTFKRFGFIGSLIEKKPIPGSFKDEKNRISPLTFEISIKYRY